jgi:6-phosphogluconolactonase
MDQKIINYPSHDWAKLAAIEIHRSLEDILSIRKRCSVMLTGGRTARDLYTAWSKHYGFNRLRGVNFYFSDERCVEMTSLDSNYSLVMGSLFINGIPSECHVFPIDTQCGNLDDVMNNYSKLLPRVLDIIILTLGDDGHVASLFVKNKALLESEKKMAITRSINHNHTRVTITPVVIGSAIIKYLLAPGAIKAKALNLALNSNGCVSKTPGMLMKSAIIFTDEYFLL